MGLVFVFGSILSFGLSNSLWKYPLQRMDFIQIIVLRSFLTAIFFGVLLVTSQIGLIPDQWHMDNNYGIVEIVKAIILCIFSFFGLYFYVKSLKVEKIAIAVPVSNLSGFFGVLTAYLFLREKMDWSFYSSIGFFVSGVMLVSDSSMRSIKVSKGIAFNMLAAFFWGVSFALFVYPVRALGVTTFSFILEISVCLCSTTLLRLEKGEWSFPMKEINNHIILLAVLGFVGVLFYNLSLLYLPVSLVSLLSVITPVVSVIAAFILFSERLTIKQNAGVVLIIVGLIILNL